MLKEHIDARLPSESIYSITWPVDPEERSSLDSCFMMVEAHAIACAQAIHAIADNLAHVVYFALGVNLGTNALQERDVTIHRVISTLDAHVPNSAEVTHSLCTLLGDPSFQAVDAFVNVTKHRGFAATRLNVDPPDSTAPYTLEFGAFAYRDVPRPEREIEDVLAPAYSAASRAVVETGNAVNVLLSR